MMQDDGWMGMGAGVDLFHCPGGGHVFMLPGSPSGERRAQTREGTERKLNQTEAPPPPNALNARLPRIAAHNAPSPKWVR